MMPAWRCVRRYVLSTALIFVAYSMLAVRQADSGAVQATTERDGQHDFDPLLGAWKEHTKIRQHPLSGSDTWTGFEGVDVYRKIWDGRAILGEYEGDSDKR